MSAGGLQEIPPPIFPWDEPGARLDWYRQHLFWLRRMASECEPGPERIALHKAVDALTAGREAAAAACRSIPAGPTARELAEERRRELEDAEERRVSAEMAARRAARLAG